MSTRAFQGQNDAPQPAQDSSQIGVHDRPTQSTSAPRKMRTPQLIDTNDHTDSSEFAKRHADRLKEFPDEQPGTARNTSAEKPKK